MRRGALITPVWLLAALAASALWALTPGSAGAHELRARGETRERLALTLAQDGARWACPSGRCDAIYLASPRRVADGWQAAGRAGRLLQGAGELGGFDPKDLQSAYHIPTAVSAPQTVAVIDAYDYPAAESDLAAYRKHYELAACTKANGCFRKVNGSGEEGNYPPVEAAAGWGEEASLDLDMVSAACPQCHLVLVETPDESDEALSAGNVTAAALGANEISNSWGEAERYCGETCKLYEQDFEQPGVLITASGGDEGYASIYTSGSSKAPVSPEFPADLANVVSVGGTGLFKDAEVARGWREEVWNEPEPGRHPPSGIGTGSGCGSFLKVSKPSWQSDAGCAYRTDNDVAAVAAPATPVSVYFEGKWELAGGTSVSAPLLAGIEAHASAYTRSLGPEAFYEDSAALNDVTEGFNYYPGASPCAPSEYLCNALAGYDGPTGLGTPHGVPLVKGVAPEVSLGEAGDPTATTEQVSGSVNPKAANVSVCEFEYGSTTKFGKLAKCSSPPGAGVLAVPVAAELTLLKGGTTYDFRLDAKNSVGAAKSAYGTFTTPRLPVLALAAPSEVGASSAQLNGSVNPEGLAIAECSFEYGTSTAYGKRVACASTPAAGTSPVTVTAPISGLKPASAYDFRLTATSSAGLAKSTNGSLRTLKAP